MAESSILVIFHFVELVESVLIVVTGATAAGVIELDLAVIFNSTVSVVAIKVERDSPWVFSWVASRVLQTVSDHF